MIEGTNNYSHDYVSYSFTQDAKYGEFADKHSSINESIWIKEDKNHNKIEEYSAAEKKDSGNLLFEYFDKDENGIYEHRKYYDENGNLEASEFNDNDTGVLKKLKLFEDGKLSETRFFEYNKEGQLEKIQVANKDGKITNTQTRSYDENGKLAKMAEDTTGDGIPEIVQVFDVNK